jgi:hypothetical protein
MLCYHRRDAHNCTHMHLNPFNLTYLCNWRTTNIPNGLTDIVAFLRYCTSTLAIQSGWMHTFLSAAFRGMKKRYPRSWMWSGWNCSTGVEEESVAFLSFDCSDGIKTPERLKFDCTGFIRTEVGMSAISEIPSGVRVQVWVKAIHSSFYSAIQSIN